MSVFTKDLDDLILHRKYTKCNVVRFLQKNYKENLHYIIQKNKKVIDNARGGGHNKITYRLTNTAFELLENTYNLRNRYLVDQRDTVKSINIGMCIENQTIGFIENSFKGIIGCKRQFSIGKYRVDLYFPDYQLAVECDENNHVDRNPVNEKIREEFILSQGCILIRYNPNTPSFDLSNVIQKILIVVLGK